MLKKIINILTVSALFLVVLQGVTAQEQTEENNSETSEVETFQNEVERVEEISLNDVSIDVGEDTEFFDGVEVVDTQGEQIVEKTVRASVTFPATIESIFPDPELAKAVAEKIGMQPSDTVTTLNYFQFQRFNASDRNISDLTGLDELVSLRELVLTGNEITDITNVDFSKLPQLSSITLADNKITTLNGVNWGGKKLGGIALNNNPITEIKTADWSTAPNLEFLSLSGCQLTNPETDWSSLTKMRELNLSNNQINDLSTVDWHGLETLQVMHMQNNQIKTLAGVSWDGLDGLGLFDLSNNYITDLRNADFTGLKVIFRVGLWAQEVRAPELAYNTTAVFDNIVLDEFGNNVPAQNISNGGIYNSTTGVITWTVPANVTTVSYTWHYETTITEKTVIYGGTVYVPLALQYRLKFIDVDGGVLQDEIKAVGDAINAPTAPTIVGFTFTGWTPAVADVMPARDVTYYAEYDMNQHNVTFKDVDGRIIQTELKYYSDTITAPDDPTRTGFTFTGWTPEVLDRVPDNDVTYTATYLANTDTRYKVEHYQEQLDGSYVIFETEDLQGKSGDSVDATIKNYTGFTQDPTHQNSVVRATIEGDGSSILKVYYARNQYSITFQDHDGAVLLAITGKYGESIIPPANPTRASHIFSYWAEVLNTLIKGNNRRLIHTTIPAYDVTYIANYTPVDVTPVPTSKPTPDVDDGGPFTTDACGTITDRWGNIMYKPSTCQITTGYVVPDTGVK